MPRGGILPLNTVLLGHVTAQQRSFARRQDCPLSRCLRICPPIFFWPIRPHGAGPAIPRNLKGVSMRILEVLRSAQGGAAIDNLANSFGIAPAQAEAILREVVPELRYGMERNTLSRGGVAELIEQLGSGHYAKYGDDAAALRDLAIRDDGNRVLGQLLGSKFSSRALAARASASTGISASIIKAMLPYIASILMGSLAQATQGGLGDILQRLPQILGGGARKSGRRQNRNDSSNRRGSSLPMPDTGAASGSAGAEVAFDGSPLPLPNADSMSGNSNPYSDIGDVLREGGRNGGYLWRLLRSLLGGVLGFQSRGVIGWFIRLILLRFGWRIVKAIFGRLIGLK